jgi:hypothetical protein
MTENRSAPASNSDERLQNRFTSGPAIVLYLAAAKLLLQLLTASRYGIFRDELYYLACAEHLTHGVTNTTLFFSAGGLAKPLKEIWPSEKKVELSE